MIVVEGSPLRITFDALHALHLETECAALDNSIYPMRKLIIASSALSTNRQEEMRTIRTSTNWTGQCIDIMSRRNQIKPPLLNHLKRETKTTP